MTQPANTRQQVQRVLLITLVLNLIVALSKIALGVMTGALAITADGFHSLTDGAGNIAGLVGNALAQRPPDDDHPYGHRRFETMAALLIGAFLLLTAWEMLQRVFERLQTATTPQISPLVFGVLLATLLVNIIISRYQTRAGQRLQSEVLIADARNTRADIFVTLSVLASTAVYSLTGWIWIDLVAGAVVVLLIGRAAWQIVRDTGRVLVDTAPYEPDTLRELLVDVPQVQRVTRARSRGPLDAVHIDIDVQVAPELTADHSAGVATSIRERLNDALTGISEVEVHFAPDHERTRDAMLTARALADAHGLATHEVQLTVGQAGCIMEMHVEVSPEQTLLEAHEQVTKLERAVCVALPQVQRVISHIEPRLLDETSANDSHLLRTARLIQVRAQRLLQKHYPQVQWHDFNARAGAHGFCINLHAALPAQMTVEAAHRMAETAELLLRGEIPELARIIIHTEPFDHA